MPSTIRPTLWTPSVVPVLTVADWEAPSVAAWALDWAPDATSPIAALIDWRAEELSPRRASALPINPPTLSIEAIRSPDIFASSSD